MVEFVRGVADFRAEEAWEGRRIATFGDTRSQLLWTDKPFRWHVNSADELFVVINGRVDMQYREAGVERRVWLETGDMAVIRKGEEHVASPAGEARILIVASPAGAED